MERPPTRRLFIALMADTQARAAIVAQRQCWDWPSGTRLTPPDDLHLTLHFLGNVAAPQQQALQAELAGEPAADLPLVLRTLRLWQGGIAVLCPDELAGLRELHERLGRCLSRAGLAAEHGNPWTPHVTLARNAGAVPKPPQAPAIPWRARNFALVWSKRPGGYEVVADYPSAP